jgi:NTE family protein
MLSAPLDILRIRQYFNAITMTREVLSGIRDDVTFLDAMRRAVLPLPFDGSTGTTERHPFPHQRVRPVAGLRGQRIAVIASGGSGALSSVVGVARALEESGVQPSAYSLCSGSALFGFPLAAGLNADEVAEFTLGLTATDLVDVDWKALALLGVTAARGFTGAARSEKLERAYLRRLGRMTLGDAPIPAYAPVWNVERNRVEYIGPRTHPRLTLARAVRMAVALPLFLQAVPMGRHHYYDGGSIDIFPVAPVLDVEPVPDMAIGVNCFYPHEFLGEDVTGWTKRPFSILYGASQIRTGQHMELGRQALARLRATVPAVLLVEPVPYSEICGSGLYRQFVDNSQWPDFMRAGRTATLSALRDRTSAAAA